jgi:hypothetical protein
LGNCFGSNTTDDGQVVSSPEELQAALPCPEGDGPPLEAPGIELPVGPGGPAYQDVRPADPQPSMPDADSAPRRPAPAEAPTIDLDAIELPS